MKQRDATSFELHAGPSADDGIGRAAGDEPALTNRLRRSAPLRRSYRNNDSRRAGNWSSWLPPLVLAVVIVAGWVIVTEAGVVPSFFLPTPGRLIAAAYDAFTHQQLAEQILTTFTESLLGCLCGALVALPLGYAMARSQVVARAAQPYIPATQALPAIALAPLLTLWLGYGLTPIVILCAIMVFFPMVVNTILGLRTIDPDVLNAARVDGAVGWQFFWHIEMPLALPIALAGLRTGCTLSITGAVVGEFVVGGTGLGEALVLQRNSADSSGEFATLLVLGILGIVIHEVVRAIEVRFRY